MTQIRTENICQVSYCVLAYHIIPPVHSNEVLTILHAGEGCAGSELTQGRGTGKTTGSRARWMHSSPSFLTVQWCDIGQVTSPLQHRSFPIKQGRQQYLLHRVSCRDLVK